MIFKSIDLRVYLQLFRLLKQRSCDSLVIGGLQFDSWLLALRLQVRIYIIQLYESQIISTIIVAEFNGSLHTRNYVNSP